MDPELPLSPYTGGKLLTRDCSVLCGLSIKERSNYIRLSASSDAKGRFYLNSLSLDVDKAGIRALAKKKFVALYRHENQDVGYIPGGESLDTKYANSSITTEPPDLPHKPSKAQKYLHRDHRLLYREIGDLETVVLHALICLSDHSGRGEFNLAALSDILGPSKTGDGSRVTADKLKESVANLKKIERLITYEVSGGSYYMVQDAKQWGLQGRGRRFPSSKLPPPPGKEWDYSFDSPEGLQWHDQRKETRKENAEKRKKRLNNPPGASERLLKGTATTEDLNELFSKPPHKKFNPTRSSPILFAAHVLKGKANCWMWMFLDILRMAAARNNEVELTWFADITGKSLAATIDEKEAEFRAGNGLDYKVNQQSPTPAGDDRNSNQINKSRPTKPFKTGIKRFDEQFASRAKGGDCWLVFGPPGAGKSMFACQTAGFTADEQKIVALVGINKNISDALRKGFCATHAIFLKELTSQASANPNNPHPAALRDWVLAHIQFFNISPYNNSDSFNFDTEYQRILSDLVQSGKQPDLVILDNLQDVLPKDCESHEQKRDYCDSVAKAMAATAKKMNHVAMLIAKGNPECANSDEFKAKHTADSSQLSQFVSGVIGITRLQNLNQEEAALDNNRQLLMVMKSPMGGTERIVFERQFEKCLLANIQRDSVEG